MYRALTIMLLIGHLLGDYYFQTNKMAINKELSFKTLLFHGVLYTGAMVFSILPFYNVDLLIIALIISAIHFVIDFIKYLIITHDRYENKMFVIDQLLHLLTIVAAVILINYLKIPVLFFGRIKGVDEYVFMHYSRLLLLVLFIMKPTSIIIRQMLKKYTPTLEAEDEDFKNAGSLIGILERLLILVLLFYGQFVAIGFVLTAKSITRYDKITKNPQFSEYYLLGTLLSILMVVVSFLLFGQMMW